MGALFYRTANSGSGLCFSGPTGGTLWRILKSPVPVGIGMPMMIDSLTPVTSSTRPVIGGDTKIIRGRDPYK